MLLLDTAMEILVEGGLEALTIPRLAERMDASVGGLYRYFPSKEAIFVALQERAIDAFAQAQREAVSAAEARACGLGDGTRALLRVLAAFHAFLEQAERAPAHHALVDAFLSAPAPTLSDAQARAIDTYLTPVLGVCAEHLAQAAVEGALGPGDALVRTHVLWAALHGLDHFRKRDHIQPAALRVAALERTLFRATFIGWGGAPDAVDEALALLEGPALTTS
ncbi:MAG: helix-turn-helix domain-containing protein [Myxococcota bacterium]|nr:helix-turn-helix domain-containing protein [Myxococcota bacterium]